ncbi:FecCD family ABC transporter permease [Rhodobacter maris]|uniref:Iron complex transport system permease protein n=1 Tax=Rhodobacter maris TaxID=446682 RepID=A0A285RHT7_9RHOB|nr:iron ABC transporter permease [Rhodobacter maris]SOB93695.1 iron complex transport system permease protein [Rhodobacter maris]
MTEASLAAPLPRAPRPGHRLPAAAVTAVLLVILGLSAVASLSLGASGIRPWEIWSRDLSPSERAILFEIRLPRLLLGLLVGAGLAMSGALMQGLFRNPLADPGLVGVGAGAGLGAVLAIVLGGLLPLGLQTALGTHLVPVSAFAGGWVAVLVLHRVAHLRGQTSIATLLLAGIVLSALAGAFTGILIFIADDAQLRDLTFWGLGSLAGASWAKLMAAAPIVLAGMALTPFLARGLDAMALGEAVARHLGQPVERIKRGAILAVAAMTGAAVAVSGGIGFLGIVVPHILRLAIGPGHRLLLPLSALFGAALLVAADTIARLVVAPAELPIGIIMALIGAPVFLWILLARRGQLEV